MSVARRVSYPAPEQVASPTTPTGTGESFKGSESSRLLCSAAYLNSAFREQVIQHCLDDEHRAIGPTFGVDLTTIVRHCQNAQRQLGRRDWWLLVPLLAIAAVWLSVSNSNAVAPGDPTYPLLIFAAASLWGFAVILWFKWRPHTLVARNFLRGKFDPDQMLGKDDSKVEHLAASENGNVLIYSGFTPFVGSGVNLNGWSFALDLSKSADLELSTAHPEPKASGTSETGSAADRVTVEELYERMSQDIRALHLDRVTIDDKMYVNGRDIRDDKRFLSHPLARPQNHVAPEVIKSAMLQSEQRLRHYRCIRVVDWSGELVLSIFLRFSKLSHNLFVEASYFLLTPVASPYREVDSMTSHLTLRKITTMVVYSMFVSQLLIAFAPFLLLWRLLRRLNRWSHRREEKKQILENPSFDYGATFSVRQWSSSVSYHRYFQMLDKEMYFKVLEKTILDSILTLLEERNIDVSELKQRQTTILNNGVIVSGGNLTASGLAVGEGAKTLTTVTNKISQFTAHATAASGGK